MLQKLMYLSEHLATLHKAGTLKTMDMAVHYHVFISEPMVNKCSARRDVKICYEGSNYCDQMFM